MEMEMEMEMGGAAPSARRSSWSSPSRGRLRAVASGRSGAYPSSARPAALGRALLGLAIAAALLLCLAGLGAKPALAQTSSGFSTELSDNFFGWTPSVSPNAWTAFATNDGDSLLYAGGENLQGGGNAFVWVCTDGSQSPFRNICGTIWEGVSPYDSGIKTTGRVNALAYDGSKFLYAGFEGGQILVCDPTQAEACSMFHFGDGASVTQLVYVPDAHGPAGRDALFVGKDDQRVYRCSVVTDSGGYTECDGNSTATPPMNINASGDVTSMTYAKGSVYVGSASETGNALIWQCNTYGNWKSGGGCVYFTGKANPVGSTTTQVWPPARGRGRRSPRTVVRNVPPRSMAFDGVDTIWVGTHTQPVKFKQTSANIWHCSISKNECDPTSLPDDLTGNVDVAVTALIADSDGATAALVADPEWSTPYWVTVITCDVKDFTCDYSNVDKWPGDASPIPALAELSGRVIAPQISSGAMWNCSPQQGSGWASKCVKGPGSGPPWPPVKPAVPPPPPSSGSCDTSATAESGTFQIPLGGQTGYGATLVEAWGADGGTGNGGSGAGGPGGYAQAVFPQNTGADGSPFTATAYVGCAGNAGLTDGDLRGGGGGGAATVISLAFAPFTPSGTGFVQDDPSGIVAVAGGGGGGSGYYGGPGWEGGSGAGAHAKQGANLNRYVGGGGDDPGEDVAVGGNNLGDPRYSAYQGPIGVGGSSTCGAGNWYGSGGFGGAGGLGGSTSTAGGTWGFDLGEYEPDNGGTAQLSGWGGAATCGYREAGGGGGGGGFGGGGGDRSSSGAGGGSFSAFGQYIKATQDSPGPANEGPSGSGYVKVTQNPSPKPSGVAAPAPIGRSQAAGSASLGTGSGESAEDESYPSAFTVAGWVPLFHNLLNDSNEPVEIETHMSPVNGSDVFCYTSANNLQDTRMPPPLPNSGTLATLEGNSFETYGFWWNSTSKIYQANWYPEGTPNGGKQPSPYDGSSFDNDNPNLLAANANGVACNNTAIAEGKGSPGSSKYHNYDYYGDSLQDAFYLNLAPSAIPSLSEPVALSSQGAQGDGQLDTTPYWTPSWDSPSKTMTLTGPDITLSTGLSLVTPSDDGSHNPSLIDDNWGGDTSDAPSGWGNTNVLRFDIQGPTYKFSGAIPDKLAVEPYEVYGTTNPSCSQTDPTQSCWTSLGDLLPISDPTVSGKSLTLPEATFFWENCVPTAKDPSCTTAIQTYSGFLVFHEFEGESTALYIDPSKAQGPSSSDVEEISKVDALSSEDFTMLNNGTGALPLELTMEANSSPISANGNALSYLYDYFYLREYDGTNYGRVFTNLYNYVATTKQYDRPLAITSLPAQHTQPITVGSGQKTYNITTWGPSGEQIEAMPIYGPPYGSGCTPTSSTTCKKWVNNSNPLQITPVSASSNVSVSPANAVGVTQTVGTGAAPYAASFTTPGGVPAIFHYFGSPATPAIGLLSSFTAHTNSQDFYGALAKSQTTGKKCSGYASYGFRPLQSHALSPTSSNSALSIGGSLEPDEKNLAGFFVADDGTPFIDQPLSVTPSASC